MMLRKAAIALLAAISAFSLVEQAGASGYQVRENSTVYQGTAFAGQASGDGDLSVMFANPATMTQFSGSHIEGNATEVVPRAIFTGSATTTGPGFATRGVTGSDDEVNGGTLAFVPAIYAMTSITSDLKAGISLTAPYGLMTRYDPDWVGRYNALRSELSTIDINPSVAYRVLPWLSVGGGVSAQYAKATLTRALNFSFLGQPDGNFRVDGDSWGFGFNGGILLQPLDGTRIGLAYRSQVYHRIEGDADFTVSPVTAAVLGGQVADSGASAEVRSPSTITASLTQRVTPALDVMFDVQWTNWEVFDKLLVQRDDTTPLTNQAENWRNTWFAALGAAWRLDDQWTLRTGIAYDKTPMKDEFRTARLPDQDRYWLSFGLGYKLSDALSLDAGYTHIFIPGNSPINEVAPGGDGSPTVTGGHLVGSYDAAIDIVSLAARFRF
jgi:long-chain fatty acid transport protein